MWTDSIECLDLSGSSFLTICCLRTVHLSLCLSTLPGNPPPRAVSTVLPAHAQALVSTMHCTLVQITSSTRKLFFVPTQNMKQGVHLLFLMCFFAQTKAIR